MAPQESPTPRDPDHEEEPHGHREVYAPHAHPSTEDHDDTVEAHYSGLERLRPCACMNGTVFFDVADEYPALYAGVGEQTLEAGVVSLYGVVVSLGG